MPKTLLFIFLMTAALFSVCTAKPVANKTLRTSMTTCQMIVPLNVIHQHKRPTNYPLIPLVRFALISVCPEPAHQCPVITIQHGQETLHLPIVQVVRVFDEAAEAALFGKEQNLPMAFEDPSGHLQLLEAKDWHYSVGKAANAKEGACLLTSEETLFIHNKTEWENIYLNKELIVFGKIDTTNQKEPLTDNQALHKAGSFGQKKNLTLFYLKEISNNLEHYDNSFFDENKIKILKKYLKHRLLISSSFRIYIEFPEDKETKRQMQKTIPKYPNNIYNISEEENSGIIISKSPKYFYKLVPHKGIWIENKKDLNAIKEMYLFYSYLWHLASKHDSERP